MGRPEARPGRKMRENECRHKSGVQASVCATCHAHLRAEVVRLQEENSRLEHLHKLDHSLADQREKERDALQEENARLREALKDTAWELDCVLEALNEATDPEIYAVTKSDGTSALVVARAALSSGATEGAVKP